MNNAVTVRVWSAGGDKGHVFVYLVESELPAAGLKVGDDLVLDVSGAVVRGIISKDRGGVYLGTDAIRKEWSRQRIMESLRAVGITNPHTTPATIVARNGVGAPTEDPKVLERHAAAIRAAGSPTPSGNVAPKKVECKVHVHLRDPAIVDAVRKIAAGHCELCARPAPFHTQDNTPFLEVHHVITLANNGPDTLDNAVALCPNCHRFMHHASDEDRSKAIETLRGNVARLRIP